MLTSVAARGPLGRLRGVVIGAALIALFGTLLAPPADAAGTRPPFQMPFRCGERWEAHSRGGHSAVDWNLGNGSADLGKTVTAAAAGIANAKYQGEYGYYVDVDHGGGWVTRYAHLRSRGVEGPVAQGEPIGQVGSTGSSSAPHLHWEQRANGVPQSTLVANDEAIRTDGREYTSRNCLRRDPFLSGDIDGNGKDDLAARFVAADGSSRVRTVRGRASRSMDRGPTLTLTPSELPSTALLSLADTNGDGHADLNAAYERGDGVQFVSFYGAADGSFGSKRARYYGSGWRFTRLSSVRGADVDGDGIADLVARFVRGGGDSVVHVLAGASSRELTKRTTKVIGASALPSRAQVTLADTTGDGRSDLNAVFAHGDGLALASFYGNRNATFGDRKLRYVNSDWRVRRMNNVRAGDVNGDGIGDVVVRFARRDEGSTVRVVRGADQRQLQRVQRKDLSAIDLPADAQLAVGDTDGNGRDDLNSASARGGDVRFSTFNGKADGSVGSQTIRYVGQGWQFHRLC